IGASYNNYFASNVGIGATSPSALLDVAGAASVSGQLKLYGTSQIQSSARQTLTIGGDTTGDIAFQAGGTNPDLYLASTGDVGIGTTNPGAQLEVDGTTMARGNSALEFSVTNASGSITPFKVDTINGAIGINNNNSNTELGTLDVRAGSGTIATASISGATSFAGLLVDNSGSGDLFTASKSGATKFTILNN